MTLTFVRENSCSLLIILSSFFIATASSLATSLKALPASSLEHQLAGLEASSGGRIGVYVINTANNKHLSYRANEPFPMGCTSKIIGVATILKQSVKNSSLLSLKIRYSREDLVHWSPITEKHLNQEMTIAELGEASICYSDNTAMNLLVKQMGGLEQMNQFAHSIGNASFRQDNDWPAEAFSGGKGDLKDSSTPKDMAKSLQTLAFTNALPKPQQKLLLSWLKANTTGNFRIRAGLPKDWVVGDKTGTGAHYGTSNDLAIIWPPHCAPIIMAIYYTHNNKTAIKRDDIVASTTRLLINELSKHEACINKQLNSAMNKIV